MATTVDLVLDEIARLSLEDQELVDEIMKKRIIEGRREEIHTAYTTTLEDRARGRTKYGSANDLFGSL